MTKLWLFLLVLLAGAAVAVAGRTSESGASALQRGSARETAVFAGGCFWCTEADFDKMDGVISTTSGYIGGSAATATYKHVSRGGTGHIEAVRVVYDSRRISYAQLTTRFFRTIDPFDDGGAFCDRGYQYRSAIFVGSPREERIAEAARAQVQRKLGRKVETLILPATKFYPAEEYHQDYYKKNPARYRFYRWNCGRDRRLREVWN